MMAATTVLRSPVRMYGGPLAESLFRSTKSPALARPTTTTRTRKMSEPYDDTYIWLPRMSISEEDKQFLALLTSNSEPQRPPDPSLERFQVYESAVQVYKAARREGSLPLALKKQLDADRKLKQRMYQLVFEALHHKEVIEDMLLESSFYSRHFELHSHKELVLLMAYEFQNEKFSLRLPKEGIDTLPSNVVKVAEALWAHKVKLGATLARMRVKENAHSVTQLISDPGIRSRMKSMRDLLCSARINPLKVNNVSKEIILRLQEEGMTVVQSLQDVHINRMCVYWPKGDLLLFSADCRGHLDSHSLVTEGSLVLQDLPSYFCVEQMRWYLERYSGDVLFTNCHSGTEVLHAASILGAKGTVRAFNVSPAEVEPLNSKLSHLGVTNVQLISAPFLTTTATDEVFSNIRLIICLPPSPCPPTNTHQVDYVLQEGDTYLPCLCPNPPSSLMKPPSAHAQIEVLSHALTFEQVEHIVFLSHSLEGGPLVRKALEEGEEEGGKSHFSLSAGTVSAVNMGVDSGMQLIKKEHSYNITILNKNHPKSLPAKKVIARAVARGILDMEGMDKQPESIIAPQHQILKRRKTKKDRINALHKGLPTENLRKLSKKKL